MADHGKVIQGEDDEVEEELEWSGSDEEDDGELEQEPQESTAAPTATSAPAGAATAQPSPSPSPSKQRQQQQQQLQPQHFKVSAGATDDVPSPPAGHHGGQAVGSAQPTPAQPAHAVSHTVSVAVRHSLSRVNKHLARHNEEYNKTLQAVQAARFNLSSATAPTLQGILELTGQSWSTLDCMKLNVSKNDL